MALNEGPRSPAPPPITTPPSLRGPTSFARKGQSGPALLPVTTPLRVKPRPFPLTPPPPPAHPIGPRPSHLAPPPAPPPAAMARPPASAPWPDSRHAPRRGGPSQPTPPLPPPLDPPPDPPNPPPGAWLLPESPPEVWLPEGTPWLPGGGIWVEGGGPDPTVPPPGGGSRRVLFADALGLPLASLRQYPPGPPRGFEGPPPGSEPSGERGGCEGLRGDPGGGQDPESWMRPGQGR